MFCSKCCFQIWISGKTEKQKGGLLLPSTLAESRFYTLQTWGLMGRHLFTELRKQPSPHLQHPTTKYFFYFFFIKTAVDLFNHSSYTFIMANNTVQSWITEIKKSMKPSFCLLCCIECQKEGDKCTMDLHHQPQFEKRPTRTLPVKAKPLKQHLHLN